MDKDGSSSIVGIATDVLGDLLLGGMVLYAFSAANWFNIFPAPESITNLSNSVVGIILLFATLVTGHVFQAIGFPIIHQWIFRSWLKWNPADDLIRSTYLLKRRGKLFGRPKEFTPTVLVALNEAIYKQFPRLKSEKPLSEADRQEVFRLCWRAVGSYYPAVSERSTSTAFARRNLNLKCFIGTIVLFFAFVSTHHFVAAILALVACAALLRQYVYFDGEFARNVYDSFHAWHQETKNSDAHHQ